MMVLYNFNCWIVIVDSTASAYVNRITTTQHVWI